MSVAMSEIDQLRDHVNQFKTIWFPEDKSCPKFWFRARDHKYRSTIHQLCDAHYNAVQHLIDEDSPNKILSEIASRKWCLRDQIVLAVMFDQMPRNALAIGFGKFRDCDPLRVGENVNDRFSLEFARLVLHQFNVSEITGDERLLCFFSLIFRHSNDFLTARNVLEALRDQEGHFPSLALKFFNETSKRALQLESELARDHR